MFHEHWLHKKGLSSAISNSVVDEAYDVGRRNGALGGKLIGAGGGGFLMFYCGSDRRRLAEAMKPFGFVNMPFRFDFEGAKVVSDLRT
jgi:D-glycero-alpha-D-manno-heptose-7-phosphate kinase